VRQALVNNYNNIFQNPTACTFAGCTALQHAFIRDNESGTTDVFVALLGLPSINLATNISPFCNSLRTSGDTIPAGVSRYYPDFQDFDPIRRNCHIREEVCHKNGNTNNGVNRYGLGLVLAITPTDFLPSDADAFPITACQSGKFIYRQLLPQSLSAVDACPNGDTPAFGSECQYPQTAAGGFKCLNSLANPPTFVLNNGNVEGQPATVADGRVYNEYLLKEPAVAGGQPTFEKDTRGRSIVGAFYRIHSTKTIVTPAGGFCRNRDATSQIGCLVSMSPCSIGYAGRGAADDNPGTGALKVNKLHPTVACIEQSTYPLSRKLYVNTFQGFEDADLATQELELVKCFADRTKIDSISTARGFVPLPTVGAKLPPGGGPYCEDFNETQCTGAPVNNDACANNPAGVPVAKTICGNGPPGSPEFGEQCDDGNNVAGDGCNANCQLEN
jgi:cysteine-rich repeat protein